MDTVTVTATNIVGSADTTFEIEVSAGSVPVWATVPMQTFAYNTAVNFDLSSYVISTNPITASGLPSGLSISSDRIIGSSTATGTYTITLTATNIYGTAQTTFVIEIGANITVPVWSSISTLTFRTDQANSSNLNNFVSGIPTPTISVQSGTLQSGISLVNGVLSGTPTDIVNRSITFRATNVGGTDDEQVNINVLQPPSWSTIPDQTFTVGVAVNEALSGHASGFPAPTFTATGLPAGLSINSAGNLTGTPTAVGTETVTITATNAAVRRRRHLMLRLD